MIKPFEISPERQSIATIELLVQLLAYQRSMKEIIFRHFSDGSEVKCTQLHKDFEKYYRIDIDNVLTQLYSKHGEDCTE